MGGGVGSRSKRRSLLGTMLAAGSPLRVGIPASAIPLPHPTFHYKGH